MTRREHLLTNAAEECTEVGQRLSKALRFGLQEIQPGQTETNIERIRYELDDLLTVLAMAGIIEIDHEGAVYVDAGRQGKKERKVEKFLEYAEQCGTLRESTACPGEP